MKLIGINSILVVCGCAALTCCTITSYPSPVARAESTRAANAAAPARVDAQLRRKILALDPDRITEQQVAQVLSKAPAPQIVNIHGGVYGVHVFMRDFSSFLLQMGYPEGKTRLPGNKRSYSPYMDENKVAGAVAWFYERDRIPVIMVGHSQGGVQMMKILHRLAGTDERGPLFVWNPEVGNFEDRVVIINPETGRPALIKDTQPVIYANSVGAGGATLLMPNQWSMKKRSRSVPDSTASLTGFFLPADFLGGGLRGPQGSNRYRPMGRAEVRNVKLTFGSEHVTVPVTRNLAKDPRSRAWISAYHPSGGHRLPANYRGPRRNLLWAAITWYEVKKHWCLAAQEFVRRQG
ncbi:MAG: hypothetical protein HKN82_08040 [Akkermansiaceae bacterium]|nr:hypothetical protein [Akkermansiaceae bacterium]